MIIFVLVKKSLALLKRYWDFDSFRPLQDEIVDSIIYGHDTLAILPTGGGKSICFQIPGLAREGLTIVISPLIALMQDQVQNLQSKGIKAAFINSNMSYREIDITLDNARFGNMQFLYISPERVNTELFKTRLKEMSIALFVIDEAHCISEWGHDFRPSYKRLSQLRHDHNDVPLVAFTASATKKVQSDIIQYLELKDCKLFEASAARSNLAYSVNAVEDKLGAILTYCLKKQNDSGIIYCQTRRSVKELTSFLRQQGLNAGMYHGGMNSNDRSSILDSWLKNEVRIMIATNAFGMGIDKPDVRYVLHYELPGNIEAYYQEAGRAGRDNEDATVIAYYHDKDLDNLKSQLNAKFPSIELIAKTYNALCNHLSVAIGSGAQETFSIDLKKFTSDFQLKLNETYYCFKAMQLLGLVHFSETDFSPSRIQFDVENSTLYNFQIKHEQLSHIITVLSRNYPGIFDRMVTIDEVEIAKLLNCTEEKVTADLKHLEKYGLIFITYKSPLPKITFLIERVSESHSYPELTLYNKRNKIEYDRLIQLTEYIKTTNCRQQFISTYFGKKSLRCGICDNCKTQRSGPALASLILDTLPASIESICVQLNVNQSELKPILKDLILQEIIFFENDLFKIKI